MRNVEEIVQSMHSPKQSIKAGRKKKAERENGGAQDVLSQRPPEIIIMAGLQIREGYRKHGQEITTPYNQKGLPEAKIKVPLIDK